MGGSRSPESGRRDQETQHSDSGASSVRDEAYRTEREIDVTPCRKP